jgi:hypothetical protein
MIAEPGSFAAQSNPCDLPRRRIGEHQCRIVEPDQLPKLLDQRSLPGLKNPGQSLNDERIERGINGSGPIISGISPQGFQCVKESGHER